ncbi:MAG: hypothetical protein FJ298_14650 [Planctomycetes bacterium]|nr:hypothetical protein [Planctomycetota bacterium]
MRLPPPCSVYGVARPSAVASLTTRTAGLRTLDGGTLGAPAPLAAVGRACLGERPNSTASGYVL